MFSILLSLFIGFLIVYMFFIDSKSLEDILAGVALSFGLGAGVTSYLFFFLSLQFSKALTLPLELLFAGCIFLIIRKFKKEHPLFAKEGTLLTYKSIGLGIILLFVMYNVYGYISALEEQQPYGYWDAWWFWNIKTNFMYRTMGDSWLNIYLPNTVAHAKYPLLLPAYLARCCTIMGEENLNITKIVSIVFVLISGLLLYASVAIIKGKIQALLASLLFFATWAYLYQGSWQYSDIPLSFYFLSTSVAIVFSEFRAEKRWQYLVVVGISLGCALWTKEEGATFFLFVFVLYSFFVLLLEGWKEMFKRCSVIIISLLPFLVMLLIYKVFFIWDADPSATYIYERLLDKSAYAKVYANFLPFLKTWGQWGFNFWGWILAFIILSGIKFQKKIRASVLTIIFVLLAEILMYFFIYVMTPNIEFLIGTTLDRLLNQIYPSLLFLIFIVTNVPDFSVLMRDKAIVANQKKVSVK